MKAPALPLMEALVFDTTEKVLKVPAPVAKLWGLLKASEPQECIASLARGKPWVAWRETSNQIQQILRQFGGESSP